MSAENIFVVPQVATVCFLTVPDVLNTLLGVVGDVYSTPVGPTTPRAAPTSDTKIRGLISPKCTPNEGS